MTLHQPGLRTWLDNLASKSMRRLLAAFQALSAPASRPLPVFLGVGVGAVMVPAAFRRVLPRVLPVPCRRFALCSSRACRPQSILASSSHWPPGFAFLCLNQCAPA